MINIPAKTKNRLVTGVKRFQPILRRALDADVNESDTVTIVSDILSDVFGYDKYTEITSEFAVKKTYCDLAIKTNGSVSMLIEVKAIGIDLKEQHIKQAVDYGANSGIDWVVLTNGIIWKVYKIVFSKPIETELLYELNFTEINTKKQSDLELIYYLTKETMGKSKKSLLSEYSNQKQFLNRFVIGQVLISDAGIAAIKRIMKKVSADIKASDEEIKQILVDEVIKREVFDGDHAISAKKRINKALKSPAKPVRKAEPDTEQ